ncbi:hypothetical protein [Trinickia dinghuensis]|uniref:Uncharacterized protein n=1 Tax=Trinickia dinghuensis TaxID=2291023 RepID=A0A3D8K2K8_9BURK|nr:hypothetical protein [Trinickia dinghuensis]RDU99292.1 hypothetical protein DWV00_09240 [Trinickia dinghuensis]
MALASVPAAAQVAKPTAAIPDFDSVSAPNSIVAAAQAFNANLPARSSFKSARILETMKSSSTGTVKIAVDLLPTADGLTRVREIYSPNFYVDREMVGLVQLKSKMSAVDTSVSVTQALTVKAHDWKKGGEVSFATEAVDVPGKGKASDSGLDCQVGSPVSASKVSSGLPGNAWPLDCLRLGDGPVKGYYVEALGYFLATREGSKESGIADTTVDSISIER